MKVATGVIKAFKYWDARDKKYGDYNMTILLEEEDGENWYDMGSCNKKEWNRRVGENQYETVNKGAIVSFVYDTYMKKDNTEGRRGKRKTCEFESYGDAAGNASGGAASSASSASAGEANPGWEVGQVVNNLITDYKKWDDRFKMVDDTCEQFLKLREKVDAGLTAAKKKASQAEEVMGSDIDDDIPF